MDTEKQTVKVNIYGLEYSIKVDDDMEYVQSVANYVNEIMLEIDKSMSSKTPLKIAILTALNIADELFKKRKEVEDLRNLLNKDSERLIEKINGKIQSFENK